MNPVFQQISLDFDHASQTCRDKSAFNDPAFASNKLLPIHRWVPWIAGFSAGFVKDVLERYLEGDGTVLDPFSGVGTTLVETIFAGKNAIGFEINPYAAFSCQLKLDARNTSSTNLNDEICKLKDFYIEKSLFGYCPTSNPPTGFKTRTEFYSPQVLKKVLIFQDFVSSIQDSKLKNLFRLAFAATMVQYSNYSYEPSLSRRVSAGKTEIVDFPVIESLLNKLAQMSNDVEWLNHHLQFKEKGNAKIINDSFFKYEKYLTPNSVDLIITSPPYLNNYHYNRNTRPHLYWLDYVKQPQDLKQLENANFGKYWQTVREKEGIELEFLIPGLKLEEQLNDLRSINHDRGIYGGKGWANYAASYFNDCYRFAKGINYCLKPGSSALVVIGNSILQGIHIPTDQYFAQIAEYAGLELIDIDTPRSSRVGNSIIQSDVRVVKAKKSNKLYESVVILRKSLSA